MTYSASKSDSMLRRTLAVGATALLLATATVARAEDYVITVTDLTTGQPFSPPVFATHDASLSLWTPGAAASNGIANIAVFGNRVPLVNTLTPLVGSSIENLVTPLSSPLLPGNSVTIDISADAAHPYLSAVWMLGRTNDTFAGQNDLNLLDITGTQTFDVLALDAGVSVNDELATHLLALGATTYAPENGVIHAAEGIRGIDHYVSGLGYDVNSIRTDAPASWRYDPNAPVALVSITAVPEPDSIALLCGLCATGLGLLARKRRR